MHGTNLQCTSTDFFIARQQGSRRVRFQCRSCLVMFPWEHIEAPAPTPVTSTVMDRLSKMTAVELRPIALINGITGASKMRKQDLLDRFREVDERAGLVT